MEIDAKTSLCLLLGNPVAHSLSPLIHNAGFRTLNLNYIYLASRVDEPNLGAAVKGLNALSVIGANVTSPYKEKVITYLDELSEEATITRSVNTIINRGDSLYGTSTDGPGILNALQQSVPGISSGRRVMIIGAGGAARSAAYTLARSGVEEMFVVNRSPERAQAFVELIKGCTPLKNCSALPLEAASIQPLLTACSLFLYSLPLDSPEFITALKNNFHELQEKLLVDFRYGQRDTAVMKAFGRAGGISQNGLGMLLHQAIIAFELFTGQKAPLAEMRGALDKKIRLESD